MWITDLFHIQLHESSHCCCWQFCRGPWGARSPIPENNAIAINKQVNNWKFFIFLHHSRKHDSPNVYWLSISYLLFSSFFQTGWIHFCSSGWCMCLLLGCGMYFLKVNATYMSLTLEPLRRNCCSTLESVLQAWIISLFRAWEGIWHLSWLLISGDW